MDGAIRSDSGRNLRERRVLLVGELAAPCEEWLSDWSTTVVVDGKSAVTEVDGGVNAILMAQRFPDTTADALRSKLRERGIEAPVGVVLPAGSDDEAFELGFDDGVHRPLTEWKVKTVLDRLIRRGAYNRLLREYYDCISRRIDIEERTDAAPNAEEYDRIARESRRIRGELSKVANRMTVEEYEAMFRDLRTVVDGESTEG